MKLQNTNHESVYSMMWRWRVKVGETGSCLSLDWKVKCQKRQQVRVHQTLCPDFGHHHQPMFLDSRAGDSIGVGDLLTHFLRVSSLRRVRLAPLRGSVPTGGP